MQYSYAAEDLSAALWDTRHDPKARFQAMALNRQIAGSMAAYGSPDDKKYAGDLRRQCNRRGQAMYRQLETPESNVGQSLSRTKVRRDGRLLCSLEFLGLRLVLDLKLLPAALRPYLPANWPTAADGDFVALLSLVLDDQIAPALYSLGLLEAAK